MDVTFVLSAIIFTLLAIVAATSWLSGSSPAAEFASARSYFGYGGDGAAAGPEPPGPRLNGHVPAPVPDKKKTASKKEEEEEEEAAADDWCEISGSSHDHWDVVKSVLSEEAHPHLHTGELATPVEQCSSTSSLTASRPGSENTNLDVDTSSEASSGRGRRSYIGLSDTELLKCAFSYPQTEGATESPGMNDKVETNNSLKYVPGKARSHHLEMMMSKEELEEEQSVHTSLQPSSCCFTVQREQLAAIFQLLKDNKETFGEVSERDMEEQLRLYSI